MDYVSNSHFQVALTKDWTGTQAGPDMTTHCIADPRYDHDGDPFGPLSIAS